MSILFNIKWKRIQIEKKRISSFLLLAESEQKSFCSNFPSIQEHFEKKTERAEMEGLNTHAIEIFTEEKLELIKTTSEAYVSSPHPEKLNQRW